MGPRVGIRLSRNIRIDEVLVDQLFNFSREASGTYCCAAAFEAALEGVPSVRRSVAMVRLARSLSSDMT
jgi:hypothetical protein